VTAPEAQLLQITPFDPNNIQAIASAIRDNPTLGLNPSDDGRVVRVATRRAACRRRHGCLPRRSGHRLIIGHRVSLHPGSCRDARRSGAGA